MRILLFIFLFHTATIAQEIEIYHETLFFEVEFSVEKSIESSVTNNIINNNHGLHILVTIDFYFERIDVWPAPPPQSYIPQHLTSYSIIEDNFNLIQPKLQMGFEDLVEGATGPRKNNAISSWLKPFHNIYVFKDTSVLGSGFGPIITL